MVLNLHKKNIFLLALLMLFISSCSIFNKIPEGKSYFKDHGDCEVIEYNSQRKPRSFKIRLRKKKSYKSLIKTLAHELVHVKQFALGEMSEFHDRWRDGVDHKDTEYFDLPWEIEARMMEHVLYDKYKNKFFN